MTGLRFEQTSERLGWLVRRDKPNGELLGGIREGQFTPSMLRQPMTADELQSIADFIKEQT